MAEDKDIGKKDESFGLEDILWDDLESDEEFSLESILAEYKSQAFIDGDKKTPTEELRKKAESIVNEVTGKLTFDNTAKDEGADREREDASEIFSEEQISGNRPSAEEKKPEIVRERKSEIPQSPKRAQKSVSGEAADIREKKQPQPEVRKVRPKRMFEDETAPNMDEYFPEATFRGFSDDDMRLFDSYRYAERDSEEKHFSEVNEVIRKGEKLQERERSFGEEGVSSFAPGRRRKKNAEAYGEEELFDDEILQDDDECETEPDTESEIKRFSAPLPSLRIRIAVSAVLCVLMLIITFMSQAGKSIPLGLGTNEMLITGVLLIIQFIVMILGIDVLLYGLSDLIDGRPSAETLTFISCIVTALDGIIMLARQSFSNGFPFSLISASSLFFCMCARRDYFKAMRDSLKMSVISASPYGVISESESLDNRTVLKKILGKTDGFYHKLTRADSGEETYNRAAPMLIIAAMVFSVLASVGRGQSYNFAHCFAVMASVTAAFPSAAVFSVPFLYAAVRMKRSGGAIAGWGGACDMSDSDAALITDEDIFPVGTVSLSGIKLFEGTSQKKAISYTASLIIKSDSGLTKVFSELLRSQGMAARQVDDFACYEGGGIGAVIDEERVLVGSGGFMNLMGIRIPDSINTKNTVFTAVNDELAAVFTINYVPANSVQSALVAILNTRINMLLAVRDFNVTPNMIQKKFRVSMEGVEYMPVEDSYRVSDTSSAAERRTSAILCREGLAPFSEVITRGRLLKLVTDINTAISIVGSAVALILMFFLCWTSSFASASAGNAFIFMMAVEVCVLLMSQIVRRRL